MKNYVRIIADIFLFFLSAMLAGVVFKYIGNKDVSIIQFAIGSTVGWFLFRFIRHGMSVWIYRAKDRNAEGKKTHKDD